MALVSLVVTLALIGLAGQPWIGLISLLVFLLCMFLILKLFIPIVAREAELEAIVVDDTARNLEQKQAEDSKLSGTPDITGRWVGTYYWTNPQTDKLEQWEEILEITEQHGRDVLGGVLDTLVRCADP